MWKQGRREEAVAEFKRVVELNLQADPLSRYTELALRTVAICLNDLGRAGEGAVYTTQLSEMVPQLIESADAAHKGGDHDEEAGHLAIAADITERIALQLAIPARMRFGLLSRLAAAQLAAGNTGAALAATDLGLAIDIAAEADAGLARAATAVDQGRGAPHVR